MTQPTDKMDAGLDLSGYVNKPGPHVATSDGRWTWSGLTPFVQGYTTEFLKAAGATRFDQLAPDTLAAIIKDCERYVRSRLLGDNRAHHGRAFWAKRQAGALPDFPPLSPSISPEGQPS